MAQELKQIESLPSEFVDLIADRLAPTVVPKEMFTRAYNSGARQGYADGSSKLNDLSQKYESLKKEMEIMSTNKATPEEPVEKRTGPSREESELAKQLASLKGELTQLRNEQKQTLEREKQRAVTDEAKRVIAELGFEQPEAVLLLARREADFVFDPTEPNSLIAVKAGDPTQPINGPYTSTNAKEFFEAFGQTAVGMRFRPVTQAARQGAGISGTPSAQSGSGPMSQQRLSKAWEKLGVV